MSWLGAENVEGDVARQGQPSQANISKVEVVLLRSPRKQMHVRNSPAPCSKHCALPPLNQTRARHQRHVSKNSAVLTEQEEK